MKKTVVIVDDEKPAIEELKLLLKPYKDLEVIGEASTFDSAVEIINKIEPELVFLDIALRNAIAFDMVEKLNANVHIIFATAYDEFAVKAFEINALDYLLKPIHPDRLRIAIDRFLTKLPPVKPTLKTFHYNEKILVDVRNGYKMINISDIRAITADGDYSTIRLGGNSKHLILKTLKEWELLLPAENFIRIHRSAIINLLYLKNIEKWFSNTCRVYLDGIDEYFTMSQRQTSAFKKGYRP